MQRITPFLWFDNNAEEAANFYVSIFSAVRESSSNGSGSKITGITRYGAEGPGPKGSVLTVAFQLDGQEFVGLNGGPQFKFTEAISFVVNCDTQEEVDKFWEKLSNGGKTIQCGWLKDRYGISWQIVPKIFVKMVQDKDPEKSKRVMNAMLKMEKINIKELQEAYDQR